ncbi:2-C-methyl-D-erythritol 2,4-cyclodiphosphate synthase [Acidovorax sp. M2(2025)]|uniref:2-C-methyl-D-erythritol 2,4-cyclodiphosphate synthase n=1 Tax=Acidovorax sp. M2(2025) TaxID=3411355 RepID=UPI003BF59C1C
MKFRIGEGWDVHALVPGRALVIGGVSIPHTMGLLGHSDADVLLHAITDALLGAAGLGDIGRHFPDTDAQFRGADSAVLLAEAARRVRAAGFEIGNIDSTVVAQAPRLASHIPGMRTAIARAVEIAEDQVNVKAKTAERLGPVGQGLAMEARAIALVYRS